MKLTVRTFDGTEDIPDAVIKNRYLTSTGTGTPAGDPQEASAISAAFFGERSRAQGEDPLFVGSIKTIIGHTEGTAGIAGLIKASLAVQHGIIPPNMLFETLSPKVAPFYQDVRILNEAKPWPKLPAGTPRRASVNSFGKSSLRGPCPESNGCKALVGQMPTPLSRALERTTIIAPVFLMDFFRSPHLRFRPTRKKLSVTP